MRLLAATVGAFLASILLAGPTLLSQSHQVKAAVSGVAVPRETTCADTLGQPAPAVSAGYNTNTLCDAFDSTAQIDTTYSQAAGFTWYQPEGLFRYDDANSNKICTPITISQASGILTTQGTSTCKQARLQTATYKATAPGYLGTTFTGGWYIEARILMPTTSFVGQVDFNYPSFWSQDITGDIGPDGRYPNDSNVNDFIENDMLDPVPVGGNNGHWTNHFGQAIRWRCTNGGCSSVTSNTCFSTASDAFNDDNQYHTYGQLWIPMSKNGGTGVVKCYFDGALKGQFTYTASDNISLIDTQNFVPKINAGYYGGAPIPASWDYVMVWQ